MSTRIVTDCTEPTCVDSYVTHEGVLYLVRAKLTAMGTVYEVYEASSLVEHRHEVVTTHEGALWGSVTSHTTRPESIGRLLLRTLVGAVYPGLAADDLGAFLICF